MRLSDLSSSLMTLGMGTLPNEKMANASGLFNLVRNLGGSVGIALVNTFVSRGLQSHYSRFIPHVTVYDPMYQQGSQMLQHTLTPLTAAPQAGLQAQGLIQGILLQQASLMAYIDIFRWTAFMLIIIVPGAFLLKKVVAHEGGAMH